MSFISISGKSNSRAHRIRQEVPAWGEEGKTTRFKKYAEIKLRDENLTKELDARVARERSRESPWSGRFVRTKSKNRHCPVHITDGLIRIEWGVRPRVKKFLDELARNDVAVRDALETRKDFTNLSETSIHEQENALLELVAAGDRMSALKIARSLYGYDHQQAIKFLDELSGGGGRSELR